MTYPLTTHTYIKSLDGLRAIAILLVMAFHADIITFGWMGVQLFFVLSGYLIINILWKEKFKPGTISQKMKRFWLRRSLRIFPLYYAFVLGLGVVYLVLKAPPSYREYFVSLVTYTFNFALHLPEKEGPVFTFLWSLCVEEQFYLVFPFIMFFCPPRFIKYFMLAAIFTVPVLRYYLGEYYQQAGMVENIVANKIYWNTLSHMDAFFLGGAIAVFSLDKMVLHPRRLVLLALVIAAGLGIWNYCTTPAHAPYWLDAGYPHGVTGNYVYVWEYTVLNFLFASIILLLVSPHRSHGWFQKLLESKWMVSIGKVSYGMYIFHFFIIVFIYTKIIPGASLWMKMACFVPYVVLVYIVAALSYRFFESYFIRLKAKV